MYIHAYIHLYVVCTLVGEECKYVSMCLFNCCFNMYFFRDTWVHPITYKEKNKKWSIWFLMY